MLEDLDENLIEQFLEVSHESLWINIDDSVNKITIYLYTVSYINKF